MPTSGFYSDIAGKPWLMAKLPGVFFSLFLPVATQDAGVRAWNLYRHTGWVCDERRGLSCGTLPLILAEKLLIET